MYEPHTDAFMNIRYYFDASHYKPGGPVIILAGGETGVDGRIPYLTQGIVYQLAKATNGVGVILEHRFYGTSFPDAKTTPNLDNHNYRFLTTEQALEDYVYFAKHIKFPGMENVDVTAPKTAWFAYGGSYAGAFVAFLRTLYPGTYYGAISASGVTAAVDEYWQYYQPIAHFGPQPCMTYVQKLTHMMDTIFFQNGTYNQTLKDTFGLGQLKSDVYFTAVLGNTIGYFQSRNWDPAVNDPTFLDWCSALTNPTADPTAVNQTANAKKLLIAGGYSKELANLTTPLVNWIGYVRTTAVDTCTGDQNECFDQYPAAAYTDTSIGSWPYRSWTWQYCNQWGFFQTGSGAPKTTLPLVSRLQDYNYMYTPCKLAFNLTARPDVASINKWGGYNISYPRLAQIGGHADPWRDATPLAEFLPLRQSTTDEPFILITTDDYGAVHHWDENGVFENATTPTFPPQPIKDVHAAESKAVLSWLKTFNQEKHGEI